jgi:hypothetical protein
MNENKFLKDFFTRKYEDSIGNSNFYIAFEDCGFHISPQSFTDEITKQYSKNVEIEELSNYCNCVVPVCDTIPGHSSSTISDCIELLKATIQFNDKKTDGNTSGLLPVFGHAVDKLKSQLTPLASTINGRSSFYRSNLNPDNFLDETNNATWTPYNESWSFPSTDQPVPMPGLVNPVWKIRPDMLQNFQSLQHNAIAEASKPAVGAKFLKKRHATIGRTQFLKKKAAHISPTASLATLAVSPAALTKNASMANTFLSANAIHADIAAPAQETNRFSKSLISSSFAKRDIAIQRLILDYDVAKKEDTPVKTSNVNIRFQYCIARITRPWLYKNILDINDSWYCTGLAEGFFSTGENSAANKGKLPSLPVSMILIKDLSISATFNAGDWENAKKAVALDSLNIAEADFKDLGDNDHAIESKGVQIIGWICEYLPKFPVCGDPNLNPIA